MADEEEKKLVSDSYTAEERLKQHKAIEEEINKRPLVGWLEPNLDSLFEEFKSNPSFSRKLASLSSKYSGLRRVRGDGNCFYRSLSYLLVEQMLKDKELFNKTKAKVDSSLEYLMKVGYSETSVEFFVDEAKDFFTLERFPKNEAEKDRFFGNKEESVYLVWFMRLLAAGYIKHHWSERFVFFAGEMYLDANDYCAKEVEPSEKECEQISVISLCEFFELKTCVEYLDQNNASDESTSYTFGPDSNTEVTRAHLLYRPGHYDILYPKK